MLLWTNRFPPPTQTMRSAQLPEIFRSRFHRFVSLQPQASEHFLLPCDGTQNRYYSALRGDNAQQSGDPGGRPNYLEEALKIYRELAQKERETYLPLRRDNTQQPWDTG